MLKPSVERTAARPVGAGGVAGGIVAVVVAAGGEGDGQEHATAAGRSRAQGERHQFLIEEGLGIGGRSAHSVSNTVELATAVRERHDPVTEAQGLQVAPKEKTRPVL